ncbi:MAG: hypothetical protein LQ342_006295 [Letrouitia transgressa]|nr:MAG: hypothetical protein LQ342_006295 [Letrouitia transgressa]
MSWLRRLSRDRTSKNDTDFSMPIRPPSFADQQQQSPPYKDTQYHSNYNSQDRLQSYRPATATHSDHHQQQYHALPIQRPQEQSSSNGTAHNTPPQTMAPAPDPLTRAFNDAIKPYKDKIDRLQAELEEKNLDIQALEDERADMHAWIDKRGLRADLPPSIFTAIHTLSPSPLTSSQTLAHHLDRKMTILNHDLHRLQDSLPSHLPTSTFTTPFLTLLAPLTSLSTLPHGAPLAFELLIKLAGNLNSHGGEEGYDNDADIESRGMFYARLDEVMVDVVRRRVEKPDEEDGGVGWNVAKDMKRLDKTGAILRSKLGLQAYFPRSLDVMRYEAKRRGAAAAASGGGSPERGYAS